MNGKDWLNIVFVCSIFQLILYTLNINKGVRSDYRIFWRFGTIYLFLGFMLTLLNLYSEIDFGKCGTKVFNPLIIFAIIGNIFNILMLNIFLVFKRLVLIVVRDEQKVEKMVTFDLKPKK